MSLTLFQEVHYFMIQQDQSMLKQLEIEVLKYFKYLLFILILKFLSLKAEDMKQMHKNKMLFMFKT